MALTLFRNSRLELRYRSEQEQEPTEAATEEAEAGVQESGEREKV
jgi:hypothetical protein